MENKRTERKKHTPRKITRKEMIKKVNNLRGEKKPLKKNNLNNKIKKNVLDNKNEGIDIDNLPTPRRIDETNTGDTKTMPTNDPAQDAQNPPGNLSQDFDDYTFGSLEVAEVFWQTNQPGDNIPWRKMSETQAMNLKAGTLHNFSPNAVVWQKI